MNNKNVEDKPGQETPDLVDAREKPQDGKNPLINSSYYYIRCSTKRERVQTVKVDLPNQSQNNPLNSTINYSQTQP